MRLFPKPPFSIRTIIGFMIALMGSLGLMLALFAGSIHHELVIENQRASYIRLIDLKITDLLRSSEEHARDLGVALQANARFRELFDARDQQALELELEAQFHQYFVTANVLNLTQLIVYDESYGFVAEAALNNDILIDHAIACPGLLARAGLRKGPYRTQVISDLCTASGRIYQLVLVPIGGLRPNGYLGVIVDPLHTIMSLERVLAMPVRIRNSASMNLYRSIDWPPSQSMQDSMIAESLVLDKSDKAVLEVAVLSDHRLLNQQLSEARKVLMVVATSITLTVILVALIIFRNTTVNPLRTLTQQLRHVGQKRERLLGLIEPRGTAELQELATDFNRMASELSELYSTLEDMAFTDSLTGLPNRNRFHEYLSALTQDVERPFALLLMDMDRFKAVNDTLGHHIGDELLREVGGRLLRARQSLLPCGESNTRREYCLVARIGGDEFAALIPEIAATQDVEQVARHFVAAMSGPCVVDGHRLMLGTSIGIATFPAHGSDRNTLMRRADLAMYYAKASRRGFATYEASLDEGRLIHLTLESDLIRAIDRNELFLEYQPKIDLSTNAIVGTEALVRWMHPEQGFISPQEFIPIAEKTGIIQRLTEWVLHRALQDCAAWQAEGHVFGVAVNLSPINLHHPYMLKVIHEALEEYSLKPGSLTLELTESAVMADPEYAIQVLGSLADNQIDISIDDFGTGHCSLSYIKKLPATEIKIDRSFVADMNNDSSDLVIVRSTIGLAHNMGLKVVAEGVEDAGTLAALTRLQCDHAQGYHIGRPMPFQALLEWLDDTEIANRQTV